MTNKLLDSEFFKLAAGYAKTVARNLSEEELSPIVFVAGLVLAARLQSDAEEAGQVNQRFPQIESLLVEQALELPDETIEPTDEKMPLSPILKEAIGASEGDLGAFIGRLIDSLQPLSVSDNHLLELLIPYIPAYLPDSPEPEVNGDIFAAAAFAAYETGVFAHMPGLSAHFSLNQVYLEALVERVFDGRRPVKGGKSDLLKWDQGLSQALKKGKDESERIISALNLGLTTGANIISDQATAYHEAGHAVVSWVLRPEIPVNQILVKREKDYDGVTVYDGDSPHFQRGKRHDYLVSLCISLAGRAAQALKYGLEDIDTGASSDLESATKRAWASIAYYGLDPEFGPIDLSVFKEPSGWLFDEAQKRLQVVMKEAAARTDQILAENWVHVEVIATELIAKGELNFEEFVARLSTHGLEDMAGVVNATNIPLKREVEFARSSGSHQTPEGVVRYEAGDAIVKDENGDTWPVSRTVFERLYRPFMGVKFGEDGHYHKVESTVRALQLSETSRVDMKAGRGVLLGEKGDWIVDYGSGDLAIVNVNAFARTYRVI